MPAAAILCRWRRSGPGAAAILERSSRRRRRGTHLHPELSSRHCSCRLRIRSSGTGKGGKGNGKQKRGREGGGRSRDRLEALSSEESPLRPPPGTRGRLHRAPTHRWRRGVSGAALITLGRRTRRGRPEWLRRHPISSRAAARRQSARDAGGAAGKLGCGAARRSAQSRIREGGAPAGGVGQRARRRASSRGALGVGRRGRLLCLVFVPGRTLGAAALLPSPPSPRSAGGETRPSARPDSRPEPVGARFSRRLRGAGSAPRAGFPDGPRDEAWRPDSLGLRGSAPAALGRGAGSGVQAPDGAPQRVKKAYSAR